MGSVPATAKHPIRVATARTGQSADAAGRERRYQVVEPSRSGGRERLVMPTASGPTCSIDDQVSGVGYTDVDRHYGNVNADKAYHGQHLYFLAALRLSDALSLGAFHGHLLRSPSHAVPVDRRTEVTVRFNALPLVGRP